MFEGILATVSNVTAHAAANTTNEPISFWVQLAGFIGLTLAGTILTVLYKKMPVIIDKLSNCKIFKRLTETRRAIRQLSSTIETISYSVSSIQKEFHPNGGSSLKDSVEKINKNINQISTNLNYLQTSYELNTDISNIAWFKMDENGQMEAMSKTFMRLTGFVDQSEGMGMGWVNAIHTEDADEVLEEFQKCIEQEREFHQKFRIKHMTEHKISCVTCHTRAIVKDSDNKENGKKDDKKNKPIIIGWAGNLSLNREPDKYCRGCLQQPGVGVVNKGVPLHEKEAN